VLLLDQWERQTLADRQALLSQGIGDDLPTLVQAQVRLDEALAAEPKRLEAVDSEQMELRRALGVA
jgi:hypothetical protein